MISSDKRKRLFYSHRSYLVVKSKEVRIAQEVKRSDSFDVSPVVEVQHLKAMKVRQFNGRFI